MELRHLRYFIAVAEELHFGRAARRLAMAQPPLSQQIKALEEEIGAVLLQRTKRQVELTTAGQVFLIEARKTIIQAKQAVRSAQRAARGELGQLAVGFVGSAIYGKVPSLFRLMRTRFPEVSLLLQDLTSEDQVEAIKKNRIDVGLVRPPLQAVEPLAMRVIWREPLVVALPAGNPLSLQKVIAVEALARESFIQIPRQVAPGFYDQVMQVCAQAGFSPQVVQEARTTPTIVSLVAGGMGVSLLPASLQGLQHAGVVYRPLQEPSPVIDMAVIWRPDDPSPTLRSFLEIVWEVAGIQDRP
ncbi:MAG: LysR family transcriptional regulator [Desulfocapsaceae bacterium]|nr:LysR family transcriptional regulator [Desulfocapsaceae bacterium]